MIIIVTFLFSFTRARGFQCLYDHLPRAIQIKEFNDAGRRLSTAWRNPTQGGPFRVFFDTYYLEHLTPGVSCTTASDWVFHSDSNWSCRSLDMFTDQQRQAVLDTFNNLRAFIHGTMKVIPIEECIDGGRFNLRNSSVDPVRSSRSNGQTDLYIAIYPRPFNGTSNIGTVMPLLVPAETWARPVQGYIQLNMAYAPIVGQSIDTEGDREFFNFALHGLSHILGIIDPLFELWINPNTGQAYGSNFPYYTIPAGVGHVNKTFTILHTPRIHAVLSERWGYEYFDNNPSWPVGVEMEDSGDSGRIGSHWEGRTHYTDYMTGTFFGYSYISKLSLSALEDTGWYSINMTRAEPIAWGNWRSIQGATSTQFRDFALGAPALYWPKHYVPRSYTEMQRMHCTFDHKAVFSPINFQRRVCSSSTTGQCQYPSFYDATNIGYYRHAGLDYSLIAYPVRICANIEDYDSSLHTGSSYGTNSMCARTKLSEGTYPSKSSYIGECYRMECPGYGILRIWIGSSNQYVDCTEANQTKTVAGYTGDIECPDPRIVCGIKRFDKGLSNELVRVHALSTQPPLLTRSRSRPATKSQSLSPTESQGPSETKSQSPSETKGQGPSAADAEGLLDASAAGAISVFLISFMVVIWVLVLIVGAIVLALVVRRRMKKSKSSFASSEVPDIVTRQESVTAVALSDSVDSKNFSPGKYSRHLERMSLPERSLDSDENGNRRTKWPIERDSPQPENWRTRNPPRHSQNRSTRNPPPHSDNRTTRGLLLHPQHRSTQRTSPHPEDSSDSSDSDTRVFSARSSFD